MMLSFAPVCRNKHVSLSHTLASINEPVAASFTVTTVSLSLSWSFDLGAVMSRVWELLVLTHSLVIFRGRSLVRNDFGCVGNTFCVLPTVASIATVVAVAKGADCKAVPHHTGGETDENLHTGRQGHAYSVVSFVLYSGGRHTKGDFCRHFQCVLDTGSFRR